MLQSIQLIAPEPISSALFEQYPESLQKITAVIPYSCGSQPPRSAHRTGLDAGEKSHGFNKHATILISHAFAHISATASARQAKFLEKQVIQEAPNFLIIRPGPIYRPLDGIWRPEAKNALFHGMANAPFCEFFHGFRPFSSLLLAKLLTHFIKSPLSNQIFTPSKLWAIARRERLY